MLKTIHSAGKLMPHAHSHLASTRDTPRNIPGLRLDVNLI